MLLWQRGGTVKKQKTALIPKGTKAACASNSVVPPKLQRIKCVPCRFRRVNAALRPTCVAGSSGVARNDPDRSTLQPWALSLDGGVCISDPIIAICHNFTFRKADTMSLCVQLNYSIRKTFVNVFSKKSRFAPAPRRNLRLCAVPRLTQGLAFGTIKSDIKSILSIKGRNIP